MCKICILVHGSPEVLDRGTFYLIVRVMICAPDTT
jgi:hypothetical protein